MNILKLKKALRESKKQAGLQFAILHPDRYGDCSSCVGASLCEKYGDSPNGIYVKHWDSGMNKSYRDLCDEDEVCIGHDITEEQFKIIKEVFERVGFVVKNDEYDECECIVIR